MDTQSLRAKQIDSLRQFVPTIREVAKEVAYEIPLSLPNKKTVTLKINLTPQFPKEAPKISITPLVEHRLVDANSVVLPTAHANLQTWTVHCSLGKTVFELIQKFIQDPPKIRTSSIPTLPTTSNQNTNMNFPVAPAHNPNTNPSSNNNVNYPPSYPSTTPTSNIPTYPPSSNYPQPNNYPNQPTYPQGNQVPPPLIPQAQTLQVSQKQQQKQEKQQENFIDLPPIPSSFPELNNKSQQELAELLNNETEFQKFFDALPNVKNTLSLIRDFKKNTEELAKKNLAKESEIETIKKELKSKTKIVKEKKKQNMKKKFKDNKLF